MKTPARQALERASRESLEASMLQQLAHYLRPRMLWQTEFRFHPDRLWRFDLACVDAMLAIECEGGSWVQGRHSRGRGFESDCEKYSEAAIAGWVVLRFTSAMIQDGRALVLVDRYLQAEAQRRLRKAG